MGDVDFIVEPIMAASGFEQLLEILSVCCARKILQKNT